MERLSKIKQLNILLVERRESTQERIARQDSEINKTDNYQQDLLNLMKK